MKLLDLKVGETINVFSIEHAHAICQYEAISQNKTITMRVHKGRKNIDITYTPQQAKLAIVANSNQS